jgi:hypothetical protein
MPWYKLTIDNNTLWFSDLMKREAYIKDYLLKKIFELVEISFEIRKDNVKNNTAPIDLYMNISDLGFNLRFINE